MTGRRARDGRGRARARSSRPSFARGYLAEGGASLRARGAEQALGAEPRREILERLRPSIEATPFEFLRRSPPDQICGLPAQRAPADDRARAREPARRRPRREGDAAAPARASRPTSPMRIASMGQTSPEVVKEIARVMEAKLETRRHARVRGRRRRRLARRDPQRRRPRRPSATCSSTLDDDEPRARRRGPRAAVRLRGHPQARRPLDPARAQGRRHEGPRARAARRERGGERADHGQHVRSAAPRCSARRWSSCSRSAGA